MNTLLEHQAKTLSRKTSEADPNQKNRNETTEQTSAEDHERRMAPYRRRLVTKQGDTGYMINFMCPSGLERPLRVVPTTTIAKIQTVTEAEYGMPAKYQHYEVGGVPLPPSATLQEMWIGLDSHLKMQSISDELGMPTK